MSEMVDRVARAIAASLAEAYSEREEPTKDDHRLAARAAVEAMREPTEGMLASGWFGLPEVAPTKGDCESENTVMVGIWQEMIDAALGKERDRG